MKTRQFVLPTWELVGGESKEMVLTLRQPDGEKYDLQGADVMLSIVDFVNSDATPIVIKEESIVSDNDGIYCNCVLSLDAQDTLACSGKYIYQVTITDRYGKVSCPRGVMQIYDNTDS